MVVRFEDVSYAYRRRQVLSHLDWTVTGGITGLVGPNAAGKSTMLALLVGLRRAQGGSVTVGGDEVSTQDGKAAARRRIGYLPQRFSLVPSMTVRNTVEYAAWLNGLGRAAAADAATRALALVDLTDRADSPIRTLSGGLRQRVGIAAAVAHEPDVVVLDEPTVGLDPGQRVRIRKAIERVGADRTVVLSTHLVEDVVNLCSTVSVLDAGTIKYHGPTAGLSGATPVTAADLEAAYERLLARDGDDS